MKKRQQNLILSATVLVVQTVTTKAVYQLLNKGGCEKNGHSYHN